MQLYYSEKKIIIFDSLSLYELLKIYFLFHGTNDVFTSSVFIEIDYLKRLIVPTSVEYAHLNEKEVSETKN